MKKKVALAVALIAAVLSPIVSAARNWDEARFGIVAGFTSSSSNAKHIDASAIARYHAGVTFELPIAYGFAVQPSLLYQAKGTRLSDATIHNFKMDTKVSYLEIPVQVQWGPDLVAFRPYVFGEPFIGYGLHASSDGNLEGADFDVNSFDKAGLSRWEYGLGLGAGIEVWKIQFSVKYYWNFGSLYSDSGKLTNVGQQIKSAFKDGRNFNGISFSLAFMF